MEKERYTLDNGERERLNPGLYLRRGGSVVEEVNGGGEWC